MSRRRRVLFGAAAVPVMAIILALLYLNFADLSGWRDAVAGLASDAIGRELRINGEFHPEIGFTTRVVATDLTLANADWSAEPHMVSVDRLAGEIDLLSLLFGPITIRDVEIDGARVLFETNDEGRFNWALGGGEPGDGAGGDVELVIGHALVEDLQLVYARPQARALEAALSKLEFTDDGTGMLGLELVGSLEGSPLEISGRLGTFIGLINASRVEHDLCGRFGDADFSLRGTISDLSSLSGVEAEVSVEGPDISRIMAALGVEKTVDGPFSAEGSVRKAVTGSDFDLHARVAEMTAKLTGTVDSLASPGVLDITVDASGPNVAAIGAIAGIEDLPAESFDVSGRVRWAGFPLQAENVEVRVGDNSLSAHGVLGESPLMEGTDFEFTGSGSDFSSVAALAGLQVPRESYAVRGRLVRLENRVGVEEVRLEVGGITVEIDGAVGDPPGYEGTALSFRGNGPNLARLQHLVGIELPAEPFEISGRLAQGEGAIELERVRARLGDTTFQVEGELATVAGLTGTDLRVEAEGPDASQLAVLADFGVVPPEVFRIEGRGSVLANGYRIHDTVASLGTLTLKGNGLIVSSPGLVGSDVRIHIDDSDLRHLASIAGVADLPSDPIRIEARLQVDESGYRVTGLEATIGEISAEADGFVGLPPKLDGTDLQIIVHGPRVGDLGPYLKQRHLPDIPFSVAGGLRVEEETIFLDRIVAEVEGNRAEIAGSVILAEDLVGTDLGFDLRGENLRDVVRLVAVSVELPELPADPYSLTGRGTVGDTGYEVHDIEATLAGAAVTLAGRVGAPPEFRGTDLSFDGQGPDASLFRALTGAAVPVAPFQFHGRLERNDAGFQFHRIDVRVGEHRLRLDGTLGELPRLIGTDLEIHVAGPDTNLYEELAGLPDLPDRPFTLDGKLSGTPERFAARDFNLTFGPSDIEGSFSVDISGKPEVQAHLTSGVIDLSRLRDHITTEDGGAKDPAAAPEATRHRLLIPDEPLGLPWLQAADAKVEVRVKKLVLPAKEFHDVTIDIKLQDGRLEIERATAAGHGQGRMTGSLSLEPLADRYRLDVDVSFYQIRLDPPDAVTQLLQRPPIDIDIDLEATGGTPHELANSANGMIRVMIGKGIMDSSVLDLVTADILLTLLKAFNPFAKENPTTELQCGVALLRFENGVAKLEPMAFQSDKMTLLGDGKIDFRTEKLNLEWITKPRKGIGISASMITNPYIRLGGTLSAPSVQLKEAEAVVSTGAAVATMGISMVAKGLFDRVTAGRKVCTRALREIEELTRGVDAASERK